MVVSRPIIAKVAQEWLEKLGKGCTLFTDFKPKRGGQQEFFKIVPFETIDPIPYRVVWARGGIGAGKSFVGSAFVCSRAFLDPQSRGLITANTYSQLETSTLIALAEFCEQFNIPIEPKRATHEETAKAIAARRLVRIFDATLLVLSAEAFMGATASSKESGRGLQIRYFWFDEGAYSEKSAFDTLLGRLGRGSGKMKGLGVLTSSINRNNPYNFAYSYFDDPERDEAKQRLYKSVNMLTADNDSLDTDYIQGLEASYTPELAAIELRGEYAVAAEGLAFSYFDRNKHVGSVPYNPDLAVHLNLDFNRHPATATLGHVSGDAIQIFHEFYQLQSDTFRLAAEIGGYLQDLDVKEIILHGDATGNMKTANSNESNWAIIHKELKERGIKYRIKYGQSNPAVSDTVNSVNALLFHDRLIVDSSCRELIKDFEFVKMTPDRKLDKKTDILRCQVIDGVRYFCQDVFPCLIGARPAIAVPVGKKLNTISSIGSAPKKLTISVNRHRR